MTIIDFTPLDNEAVGRMLTALILNEAARLAALPPALKSCVHCIRPLGQPHTTTCPEDGTVQLSDTLAGKEVQG